MIKHDEPLLLITNIPHRENPNCRCGCIELQHEREEELTMKTPPSLERGGASNYRNEDTADD